MTPLGWVVALVAVLLLLMGLFIIGVSGYLALPFIGVAAVVGALVWGLQRRRGRG